MVINRSKLVFSTESGSHKKDQEPAPIEWVTSSGPAKMRLETAGRGGKAVTVLFQLPWNEAETLRMLKAMQSGFGCGGAIKDNTLELRGDVRAKVEDFFAKKQLKIIRAGG
ncbi:MAG: translation initiation factor [Proteobacteria bacterium]|nr:translation initiation factor [Pseudomonadota bacterium]